MNRSNSIALKFKTSDILEKLRANRAKHVEVFTKAQEAFRAAYIKECRKKASDAAAGKPITQETSLAMPHSFEREYTRAEQMYAMTTETEVELEQDLFRQLILDEWSWSHSFNTTNSGYGL